MFGKLFLDHPRSVGESYFEHLRSALGFAGWLLAAGFACLLHGLFPVLFERTGSGIVRRLHDRMIVNRSRVVATENALNVR